MLFRSIVFFFFFGGSTDCHGNQLSYLDYDGRCEWERLGGEGVCATWMLAGVGEKGRARYPGHLPKGLSLYEGTSTFLTEEELN